MKIKKIKRTEYFLIDNDEQIIQKFKNKIKKEEVFGEYESVKDFKINFKRAKRLRKILKTSYYIHCKIIYGYDQLNVGVKIPHECKYEGLNDFPRYIIVSEDKDYFYREVFLYGAKDLETAKEIIKNLKGNFYKMYDLSGKESDNNEI